MALPARNGYCASMQQETKPEPGRHGDAAGSAELKEGLARLAREDPAEGWHIGSRLRNYFLTGLLIVGPVTITVYIVWWFINLVDDRVKPFVPKVYWPESYLPFSIPGIGLLFAIIGLTLIGALAANLLGRTFISYAELMVSRMPVVRNVYRGMKQIFESVVTASSPATPVQKVGLIEFPSKGLWSIVFVTGETSGEVAKARPGGEQDLLNVFIPTGIVPPTGFVCFLPRGAVQFIDMTVEDAAKVIISGGMVMPGGQGLPGSAGRSRTPGAEVLIEAAAAAAGSAAATIHPPAQAHYAGRKGRKRR